MTFKNLPPPDVAKANAIAFSAILMSLQDPSGLDLKVMAARVASNSATIHKQLVNIIKSGTILPDIRGFNPETAKQIELLPAPPRLKKVSMTDDEWMSKLQKTYGSLNVDREFLLAKKWIERNPGRTLSRGFFQNWMSRWEGQNTQIGIRVNPIPVRQAPEPVTRIANSMPATYILKMEDAGTPIPRSRWPKHIEKFSYAELEQHAKSERKYEDLP